MINVTDIGTGTELICWQRINCETGWNVKRKYTRTKWTNVNEKGIIIVYYLYVLKFQKLNLNYIYYYIINLYYLFYVVSDYLWVSKQKFIVKVAEGAKY